MDIQCLHFCITGLIYADILGCLGSQLLFFSWRTLKNILKKSVVDDDKGGEDISVQWKRLIIFVCLKYTNL